MASSENRSAVVPAVIVGLCLVAGLAIGGYFVGKGAARFRSDVRIVTVSESLQDAHTRISADRDAAAAFLRKQGVAEAEIERQPTRTVDKLAREYGQPQAADRFRYVVTTAVVVKTPNVDLVRTAVGATEELPKAGVILDGESGPFSPTSTPMKRIRVVSTFEFELR